MVQTPEIAADNMAAHIASVQRMVQEFLDQRSSEDRTLVSLRYVEGASQQEVAAKLGIGRQVVRTREKTAPSNRPPYEKCAFCEKTRAEVEVLVAGPPYIFICNECVELCDCLVAEERSGSRTPGIGVVPASLLRVSKVKEGSAAEQAGIVVGDLLDHDHDGLRRAVREAQSEGKLTVKRRRDAFGHLHI